jgi:hypothetical protein
VHRFERLGQAVSISCARFRSLDALRRVLDSAAGDQTERCAGDRRDATAQVERLVQDLIEDPLDRRQ